MKSESTTDNWDMVLDPSTQWWDLQLRDVWHYRDLLWMFVRRDFVAVYKQTVLGPLWFFVQPILTTLMFTMVFSGLAKLPTNGLPPMLFYLAGITPWNYFSSCLTKTSSTFVSNAGIFGKVYFPRLVTPISIVISNLIQFSLQFLLFIGFLFFYTAQGAELHTDWVKVFLITPILLGIMAFLGLGSGIIISSLTTKYRDFAFLVGFGMQLAMYATPIIYPARMVPEKYAFLLNFNPMASVIEAFRSIYLGGTVPWEGLGISAVITAVLLFLGIVLFKKVERTFMDTV
jgi:lipopolysaccharide transport system permease protein